MLAGKVSPVKLHLIITIMLTTPSIQGGPWNYIERIEITEREAYLKELASVQNMDRLIARGRLCRRWDGWPER